MQKSVRADSLISAMESYRLRSSDVTRSSGEVADFRWLRALAEREQWLINPETVREVEAEEGEEEDAEINKVVWRGLVCVRKVIKIPEEYVSLVVDPPETEILEGIPEAVETKGGNDDDGKGESDEFTNAVKKEKAKERLMDLGKEISILSSLRHPNLVMFLGACFFEKQPPHILLEFCPGGTLRNRVLECKAKGKSLKAKKVCNYAKEIALGINFLHCCRDPVVHCNLNPDNIFLDQDGRVKLGDFGVAAFTQKFGYNVSSDHIAQDTFRYLAPELFEAKSHDEKVDQYSYAMVCIFMNKSVSPFSEETLNDDFIRRISKENERPSLNGVRSKFMKNMIRDCWAADPAARPAFSELLKLFEEHENNESCAVL